MNWTEKIEWKVQIDKFLIGNLFIIIFGFFFFIISIIADSLSYTRPLSLFQILWKPLFLPCLSIFFTAVLVESIINKFNPES